MRFLQGGNFLALLRAFLCALPALVIFSGGLAAAEESVSPDAPPALRDAIARLDAISPLDLTKVERTLGTKLALISTLPPVNFKYEADGVRLKDSVIERVDYRVGAGADHPKSYILVLDIQAGGTCISQSDVRALYHPSKTVADPHPERALSEIYLLDEASWGTLSFGFRVSDGRCLRSVVFDSKDD
jgi:hypothetical protein